ncbi:hypothetical protein [Asticcacaulis excentricus]|uniref:Uncharacterized protein n=1 Tax=Asticcacaulis excentricus (strain ATCC 15261 / DSM 4724 / KCTC 12464 / NCIMB 9791 / VKM B-1370 / CB 48) TaxID=573065 RepID=E8RPA3_ASTEC|nr:hypothetical protein [Asticcacaulis excentricus]ADU11949.1 hypothetical protein Astex_0250 [Asticcacaulis excentricus CB 48]ADU14870.1 hypothetical protein Astex_3235 [Asticcacaulis excentricus CB 48]
MARATRVFTTKAVADLLDEDIELIEEIACNPDNIDYGEMLHIYDGSEHGATGFTDRGIQCIEEMLEEARNWDGGLRGFLVANHSEPEAIERIMAKEQARIEAQSQEKP